MKRSVSGLTTAALLLSAVALPVLAATVVVTPSQLDGWAEQSGAGTDVSFVTGPSTPPMGQGSARFTVDATSGNSAAQLRNATHTGTLLSAITRLEYSTYVADNNGGQAVYILLNIDQDGNGSIDDHLFFEPVYQNGAYGTATGVTVPNQCGANPNCIALNTWQTWNARTGGWWSLNDNNGGPPLTTLAAYSQQYPNAQIVNSTDGTGGVRLVAGFGAPAWNDFDGNADAFILHVSGREVEYDFEPTGASSSSSLSSSTGSLSSSLSSSTGSLSSSISSASSPAPCTTISTSGLVAHWKGDEGSGTAAMDSTAYNNSGALQNGAGWDSGAPTMFNNPASFEFDGTNDYILVPDTTGLPSGSQARTISLWMRQDAITNQATMVSLGNSNGSPQKFILQMGTVAGQTYLFTDGVNSANNITLTGSHIPTTGTWHHIAFVMDASGNWAYLLDGNILRTGTFSVPINTVTNAVELGSRHDGSFDGFFDGSLDDVRLYTRVLSLAELQSLANGCPPSAGSSSLSSTGSLSSSSLSSSTGSLSSSVSSAPCVPVSPANLLGHWKLDETSGSTAIDSAGGDNNGTHAGSPDYVAGTPAISPNPSALSYPDANDFTTVANSNDFDFGSGSFTVSLYARTGTGNTSVLGNFSNTLRGWGLYFYNNGNVNFFGYGSAGTNDAAQPGGVVDNQWHHVAGVYSRSGSSLTIRTYVDGVLVGTNTAAVGDISSPSDLLFGRYLGQPDYQGTLDDIRIYGRALSGSEVASLAAGCPGGISSSSISSSTGSLSSSSVSSATGALTCNGQTATIYVQNGTIVGGPDNGDQYNGRLRGTNNADVIVGTSGHDRIRGRDGDDVICALAGNDDIRGQDGDDWIDAGDGNDHARGDDGDDTIWGGAGNDQIRGNDGDDWIDGGAGNDGLQGGDGNDIVRGGVGNDSIRGGDEEDVLCGGVDNDHIRGDDDDDKLDGGPNIDVLRGGDDFDDCRNGESNQQCEVTNLTASFPECV